MGRIAITLSVCLSYWSIVAHTSSWNTYFFLIHFIIPYYTSLTIIEANCIALSGIVQWKVMITNISMLNSDFQNRHKRMYVLKTKISQKCLYWWNTNACSINAIWVFLRTLESEPRGRYKCLIVNTRNVERWWTKTNSTRSPEKYAHEYSIKSMLPSNENFVIVLEHLKDLVKQFTYH